MPGVGKMLSMAGARASSAFAGGGEFLAAANRAEPLPVAVRAGDTFLVAVGGDPLAVAVRAGTSSVADGGVARTTGGGYTGTSGAIGGEPFGRGATIKAELFRARAQ
jgi:hypothetical protein